MLSPIYRVEIRPLLVATIQRLPHRTIESIFPMLGMVSPWLALHTPLGPSKTAVLPLTSRITHPRWLWVSSLLLLWVWINRFAPLQCAAAPLQPVL